VGAGGFSGKLLAKENGHERPRSSCGSCVGQLVNWSHRSGGSPVGVGYWLLGQGVEQGLLPCWGRVQGMVPGEGI